VSKNASAQMSIEYQPRPLENLPFDEDTDLWLSSALQDLLEQDRAYERSALAYGNVDWVDERQYQQS